MKKFKLIISYVLIICMLITAVPANVFAKETPNLEINIEPVMIKTSQVQLCEDASSTYALDENGNPKLKDTNEQMWIDRMADLPEWALDFYDWLVENADGDKSEDALINPTMGELYEKSGESAYVYHLATLEEKTLQFEFPVNGTQEEISDAAMDALLNEVEDTFNADFPYMINVFGAFDRDYSEVFWLNGDIAFSYDLADNAEIILIDYNKGFGTLLYTQNYYFILLKSGEFDIRGPKYRDYEIVYETIEKRDALAADILASATGNTEEKVAYFNDYLVMNNAYNTSNDLSAISNDCYECISALEGNTGISGPVCEAYSRAFKLLCDRSDIPCVLVNGNYDGTGHMWNYVQMEDEKWYAVDVTFNDPYVGQSDGKVSGYEHESYLLVGNETKIGEETFGENRDVTNQAIIGGIEFLNGPVLEATEYVSHEHVYTSVVTEPTCTEQGYTTYTCESCGDTYKDDYTEALGHKYGEPVFDWKEDYSQCTATFTCENECGQNHVAECAVTLESEDATCTVPGSIVYTATVEFEGKTYSDTKSEIKELGHNYSPAFSWTDDKSVCIAVFTCEACGDQSSVTCNVTKEETEETVTYRATCEFKGEVYEDCIVEEVVQKENPFADVPDDEWYTEYVLWAYENGVTNGYEEFDGTYTFRPQNNCTRAEFVTFLWNLVGTDVEEDVENPFTDVEEDAWYYEYVMWAYENGITVGYEDGTFRPDATCTRAEVATFIYNIKDGGQIDEDAENPFTDVEESDWYYTFVIWGYQNGIISGYEQPDGTFLFMPRKQITRAEVVTMLYGAYTQKPVTGVTINSKQVEMIIGDSAQLEYTIAPADADIKNVSWSSSDESIVTVTDKGLVSAHAKGTAFIIITTRDGGHASTCEINVKEPALVPNVSIGIRTYTTGTSTSSEVFVKTEVTGGSGTYVSYHIDLYLDDELIAQSDTDELAVKPIQNGTYKAIVTVIDSSGTEATATSTTTISM